jgi:hypothetical protein
MTRVRAQSALFDDLDPFAMSTAANGPLGGKRDTALAAAEGARAVGRPLAHQRHGTAWKRPAAERTGR